MVSENVVSQCPHCQTKYQVSSTLLGKSVQCKKCSKMFVVKAKTTEPDPPKDSRVPKTEEKTDGSKTDPQQEPPPGRKPGGETDSSTPKTPEKPPAHEQTPDKQEEHPPASSPGNTQAHGEKEPLELVKKVIRLALEFGFITESQNKELTALPPNVLLGGGQYPSGEFLVEKGMIKKGQLDYLLFKNQMDVVAELDERFAKAARVNGYVTQAVIDQAFREQERLFNEDHRIVLLGDILVEKQAMTPQQRDAILADQKRFKYKAGQKQARKQEETIPIREVKFVPFKLNVFEGRLKAEISVKKGLEEPPTLEGLKKFLEDQGITQLVAGDDEMLTYLTADAVWQDPLLVAKGRPPAPAEPSTIRYHFDTNPLKVGTLTEDGKIDFKNRGKIPQVKEGDVLAERIPGNPGEPGVDVFGKPILPAKPKEPELKCGKGVRLLDDKLIFAAATYGMPQLTDDQRLLVHSELVIDGDVGYETGHIEFDGHIEIRGSVLDGFRVTGRSLKVGEINKSEVAALGDMNVSGGIIGGKVEVGGGLKASHVHNAYILAAGDVMVQKEIFESVIETRGELNVESGKILSSKITAKKGVKAGDIGSSTSSACQFLVGVDHSYDRKIEEVRRQIAASEKERKDVTRSIEILRGKFSDLEDELGEVAQTEDRFTVQKMTLSNKLEALTKTGDVDQIQKADQVLEYLEGKIATAQERVQQLMAQQDELTDIIDAQEEEIQRLTERIDDFHTEIQDLQDQAALDKGMPRVRVKGSIFAGTLIKGPNASLVTKESHTRVNIRELDVSKPDFPTLWSMTVTRL